jgi:hypothetical protein
MKNEEQEEVLCSKHVLRGGPPITISKSHIIRNGSIKTIAPKIM